jgi:eukaryotic-like serine/threonine-protein kinase
MHTPLAPDWTFHRRLGGGTRAEVWEVEGSVEGPPGRLALKRARGPSDAPALLQEAALLERLAHPGVVALRAVAPDGAWLAMELLPGPTLTAWAKGRPLVEVVAALESLARALAWIHENGVVHGDIKPSNVLMGADAQPKILDFGLGLHAHEGGFHGTLGGAAPEQLRGLPASPASDVFSLGGLAFRALTGGHPFGARDPAQALAPELQLPWGPAQVRPGVPRALDALVLRMLSRDPSRRPPCAGLADALRVAAGDEPYRPHPAAFLHWRTLGRALIAAVDGETAGLIVMFGPEPETLASVCASLTRAAALEGIPVHAGSMAARRGLVLLDGPTAEADGARIAAAGWPVLALITSPVPLPALSRVGAVHLDARLPISRIRSRTLARDPLTPRREALLAAVADGAVSVSELATALGMGPHAVLDLAEPLLDAGLLVEVDEGAALAAGRS